MATDIHNTPLGVNASTLPENLYPSRGFARLPQRMSLQAEFELQARLARQALDRMRQLKKLIRMGAALALAAAEPDRFFPISEKTSTTDGDVA